MMKLLVLVLFAVSSVDAFAFGGHGTFGDESWDKEMADAPKLLEGLYDIKEKLIAVRDELKEAPKKSDEAPKPNPKPNPGDAKLDDLSYLKMLAGTAKDIVKDMPRDDESLDKTMADLTAVKDKFVAVVEDMKAKKKIEQLVAPIKDELESIAHTIHEKLAGH